MAKIYSEQFFTDSPPSRIIGVETEYSCQPADLATNDMLSARAFHQIGLESLGSFLANGAKVYIDVNKMLEYATPECLGPTQAAAADMAGKIVIANIVRNSEKQYDGIYRITGSNKKGVTPVSSGHHENYLIPCEIVGYLEFQPILEAFFATRFWLGSGGLDRRGFIFNQKASGVGAEMALNYGNRTGHGSKPFAIIHMSGGGLSSDINNNPSWARLETRYSDANLSPFAKFMALATTSLVLRIIENRHLFPHIELENLKLSNSVESFHNFSNDTQLTKTTLTAKDKKFSALDIQFQLHQLAAQLADNIQLPADELLAVKYWEQILDRLLYLDMKNRSYSGLEKFLDFAAKHNFLLHTIKGGNITSQNPEAFYRERCWDRIEPQGGGEIWWEKQPISNNPVNQEMINNLVDNAPNSTRAKIRSNAIKWPSATTKVLWNQVEINGKTIFIDPYEC